MTDPDAVIIGGGHNGLVCGAYLARAGVRVSVLERRKILGGAAVTEEIWDGYRVNTAAHMMGLLQPKVILDLELARFGFEVIKPPPTVHLLENGASATLWPEPDRMAQEIARFSCQDAGRYVDYIAHLAALGPFFRRMLWEIPPDPSDLSLRGLMGKIGFGMRNMGLLRRFHDVSDLLTMSAHDYLSRWFEAEETKTILGYYPAAGSGQSVSIHTPGTAFFLIRGHIRDNTTPAGGTGLVRGGMGQVSDAIAASGRRFGMQIRTGAEVARVLVEDGVAKGVVLTSGEEIRARAVIANAAVQHLAGTLLDDAELPADYARSIRGLHGQSTAFKVHIGTSNLPRFRVCNGTAPEAGPAQFTVAPSVGYLERAYAEMRAGAISRRPFLTVQIPTVADPALAPEGRHILSIYGGHVPALTDAGNAAQTRARVLQTVEDTLAEHAALTPGWIEHSQVMLAQDYEEVFGLPGGNPQHFNLALDQMFFKRPARRFADYRTPVRGLYLCGASAHPGGGVSGVPGHNAARVVGKALGKRV